jgi:mannose-1-phosphate guanylyltransferase
MSNLNKIIPVIISGGTGSRLWPMSRSLHPKPFFRLQDGQSLLQKAFIRSASLPNVNEILTVTSHDLYFKTIDDYDEVNSSNKATSYILEPFGRNTAAAVALALLQAKEKHGDDAIIIVLAADHLIEKQEEFSNAVTEAVNLANQGYIVTFGIKPTSPETGFGYIEAENHIVKRFVEKPSAEKAQLYLQAGNYFWNAGIFCMRVKDGLQEFELHANEVLKNAKACFKNSKQFNSLALSRIEIDAESFNHLPDISIDYAVMEKSMRVAIVICDMGWSDIGSWNAMGDLITPDKSGNRFNGEVFIDNATNCFVSSRIRTIGLVGVEDLVVIDTPDALLISSKNQVQNVKNIVTQLKTIGHRTQHTHLKTSRPWGFYTVLEEGDCYKIKKIVVKPNASLSLQSHKHRSEHWVVVSGQANIHNDGTDIILNKNESTYISAGHKHRLQNNGNEDLVLIEVQSGDYLGEDDIVRFDDLYNRI